MINQLYEFNYDNFDWNIFSMKPYKDFLNHRIHQWTIDNLI